jgi:ADP-ribose pyrophosphatase YjhB (NUDIX family)
VIAYVTRERDGRRELLVFDNRDHPEAGTQVPAGCLDRGETLEEGLLRELHEEAGLDEVFNYRWEPVREELLLWGRKDPFLPLLA